MLTFGLVSIPIRLYVADRTKRTYLHQLHKECHTRLKQPLFCPTCDRFVDRNEVIKGYEYETGQYVLVEGDEIKKITPASGRTMEILAFVKADDVDPIYFDSSFLSVPEAEGKKGYRLLCKALQEKHVMGVAKLTMHQREYTVFVRPRDHGLTLHTMYYANEISTVQGYGQESDTKLNPQEVKLAEQLVQTLTAKFEPRKYHDEFQERLKALLDAKAKGKTIATPAEVARAPVIDIMQALKKSLAVASAPRKGPALVPMSLSAKRQRRKAG
jgi:DNA end-binding protein Ku